MLISLDTWRKQNTELMDVARKHGIALGIGMAVDALNECKAEKEALGTGSSGYWEALLDLNTKLHELLRAQK